MSASAVQDNGAVKTSVTTKGITVTDWPIVLADGGMVNISQSQVLAQFFRRLPPTCTFASELNRPVVSSHPNDRSALHNGGLP